VGLSNDRYFVIVDGVKIVNFDVTSTNAHSTSQYIPMFNMHGSAWAQFSVEELKIESR
jgi:hypothetical protein